jgi:L-fuconolactonase
MSNYIDTHPHIISDDDATYPRKPLFGIQSKWSEERPVTIDDLVAAMDAAGVAKAAIVQASTCYGFDNSYLADAMLKHPGRFTGVGSVDMLAPDAPQVIRGWLRRGITGFRVFTGGSTAEFDTRELDDPRVFPAWETLAAEGLSMVVQTGPVGLAQVAGLAKRFPTVKIILDHLSRPDISDGPPYHLAAPLFALSAFENVYVKITPPVFTRITKAPAEPHGFVQRLVAAYGANRITWGSNFPTSPGTLADNLQIAKECLSRLTAEDHDWIFSKTAQTLYPVLKDR